MSSEERQALMKMEIEKEEKRQEKIRNDREAGKLPEDEEHVNILHEQFVANQVLGTGGIKINGVDMSDRISRGLAVNLVKLGHTKPLLTPEEKLKEAKYNAECKKNFYKKFMPVKPSW